MQPVAEPTPSQSDGQIPKLRWYRLTPDRLLIALLPIVAFLFLSERFRWFAFNEHKNWTVLIAVAVVCLAIVLMLLWFGVSLIFRLRFQFSIRSLLLFVTLVAVVCSWFSVKMQQAGCPCSIDWKMVFVPLLACKQCCLGEDVFVGK